MQEKRLLTLLSWCATAMLALTAVQPHFSICLADDIANRHIDSTTAVPLADSSWSTTLRQKVLWYELTSAGNLFVITETRAVSLDPDSGRFMWDDIALRKLPRNCYEPIEGTPFALISIKAWTDGFYDGESVLLLNVYTGKIQWSSHLFGINKTLGHIPLSELGLVLLYGETYVKPKRETVMAVDLLSGQVRWENVDFFGAYEPELSPYIFESGPEVRRTISDMLPPVWVGDSAMALFATIGGLRKFNPYTGQVLASAPARPGHPGDQKPAGTGQARRGRGRPAAPGPTSARSAPSKVSGHSPLRLDKSSRTLYAAFDTHICALDLATFSQTWDSLPDFTRRETATGRSGFADRVVRQIEPTPAGVFVHASKPGQGDEIAMLDVASGRTIWSRYLDAASTALIEADRVVLFSGDALRAFELLSGEESMLCTGVSFKGGEDPARLELTSDGYLAYSEQNMILCGLDGRPTYHYYSNYAKKSLLTKIALGVAVMAWNVASVYAGYAQAKSTGGVSITLFDPAYYVENNPGLVGRYAAYLKDPEHLYIPVNISVDESNKPGVAKVSKISGLPEAQVRLERKNADYRIDVYSDRVFLLSGKGDFTGFQF